MNEEQFSPDFSHPPVYSLKDFLAQKFEIAEIIEKGIMVRKSKLVIAGEPKIGKSTLALQMALDLSTGKPFLGRFGIKRPHRVFLIQEEIDEGAFQKRVAKIASVYNSANHDNFYIWNIWNLRIDTEIGYERLKTCLLMFNPEILVLDPFYMAHLSEDENTVRMQAIYNLVENLIRDYNISVILTQAVRKSHITYKGERVRLGGEEIRGTSQFLYWVDTAICLFPTDNVDIIEASFITRHSEEELPKMLLYRDRTRLKFVPISSTNKKDIIKSIISDRGKVTLEEFYEICHPLGITTRYAKEIEKEIFRGSDE